MLNFKFKTLLLLLVVLIATPQISLAYFTTDQKAIQLNSDTTLYTITYKFGLPKDSLIMPLLAVRGLEFGDTSGRLGYTLLNNGKRFNRGTAYGIILSDAKVLDNEYYVPKEELATFTLVALVKLGTEINLQSEEGVNLALQVTSLPFTMVKEEKEKVRLQLNPSELQYYLTPEIDVK